MKKVISLITVFLVCIVAACAVCFAGCSNVQDDDTLYILNLEKAEIGTSIPVSPSTDFYYKASGYIIHIDEFKATLVSKTAGNEDDPFSDIYWPYTIDVHVHGFADPVLSGRTISVYVNPYPQIDTEGATSTIDDEGEFSAEISFRCKDLIGVYLYSIRISSS